MFRPFQTGQAHGFIPLVGASGTLAPGVERVPSMTAEAHPAIGGARIPAAFGTADTAASGSNFADHLSLLVELKASALLRFARQWFEMR